MRLFKTRGSPTLRRGRRLKGDGPKRNQIRIAVKPAIRPSDQAHLARLGLFERENATYRICRSSSSRKLTDDRANTVTAYQCVGDRFCTLYVVTERWIRAACCASCTQITISPTHCYPLRQVQPLPRQPPKSMPGSNLSVSADFCSLAGTEPAMKFPALLSAKTKPVLGHRLKILGHPACFHQTFRCMGLGTEK